MEGCKIGAALHRFLFTGESMKRLIFLCVQLAIFPSTYSVADENYNVALQCCEWIESSASQVSQVVTSDPNLSKEWNMGDAWLKPVRSYRNRIDLTKWTSARGNHSIQAKFLGATAETIALQLANGKVGHPAIDQLDRPSIVQVYEILDKQHELILLSYSLYTYMISAESPEDPRWTFLNPLSKQPPEFTLMEPDVTSLLKRQWMKADGTNFSGSIEGKIKNQDDVRYIFKLDDGRQERLKQNLLTKESQLAAERLLRLKTINNPILKNHAEWLPKIGAEKTKLAAMVKTIDWRLSVEYIASRTAYAETRRWIDSQPIKERPKYELAFKWLQTVGQLYRQKDKNGLKNFLNDPNREYLSLLLKNRGKLDVSQANWKGDVEDLLTFSSAGKIYVCNAEGEGMHRSLGEIWQKSAEIAVSK
jgi:hypothetical protein